MINILLRPNIIGMDINTPLKAFLEVVKITVRVVMAKRKIDIILLDLFFLFKYIKPSEKGHITDNQVPA